MIFLYCGRGSIFVYYKALISALLWQNYKSSVSDSKILGNRSICTFGAYKILILWIIFVSIVNHKIESCLHLCLFNLSDSCRLHLYKSFCQLALILIVDTIVNLIKFLFNYFHLETYWNVIPLFKHFRYWSMVKWTLMII